MTTPATQTTFMEAAEIFEKKVEGRLHVYVKEIQDGLPAISCIWNETPERTLKDVVYVGPVGFDALAAVKAINRSMAASSHVVGMLIDLYRRGSDSPLGEGVEY